MSVIMEFAMFPTDKGASVSSEVSKVVELIKNSGVNYKLGPMGTTIETETINEALQILEKSYSVLAKNSERVYSSVKFDIRKGHLGRMEDKIRSIENKIGKVDK